MNLFLAPVDLLSINKFHFDRLLKFNLLENWNILQDALVTFNYFDTWDETTVRECCIISKIKDYQPNEVMNNYLHEYFISLILFFVFIF